jgi:ABC-type transport system involved in cytochrome bd biosynthesis fused ATPase/permease subunit
LLVADEPTGNLDSRTAEAVFQLFARMVDNGKTILMVTHDDEMAHQVRRTITLTDGQIVDQQIHTQEARQSNAPAIDAPAAAIEAQATNDGNDGEIIIADSTIVRV